MVCGDVEVYEGCVCKFEDDGLKFGEYLIVLVFDWVGCMLLCGKEGVNVM